MTARKPLLCLDFDGVIHGYESGWQGATNIPDPPVPGAIRFIVDALSHFRVAIYSSRSGEPDGIDAMKAWLGRQVMDAINVKTIYDHRTAAGIVDHIEWPTSKPPAFLTIDDRAIYFNGSWPNAAALLEFKTWQQGGSGFYETFPRPDSDPAKPRVPWGWATAFTVVRGPDRPVGDRPIGDDWFPLYKEDER